MKPVSKTWWVDLLIEMEGFIVTSKIAEALKSNEKIPFHRMLAYASTDAAGNLLYCTVTTFILYY